MDSSLIRRHFEVMTSKGRYLSSQKIPDAQIERILLGYAQGMTAAEFVRTARSTMQSPPASKTVYRIYRLVRRRLTKLFTFPPADIWIQSATDESDSGGNPTRLIYVKLKLELKIKAEAAKRRGLTAGNWDEMAAEFIFRAMYAPRPKAFLTMIKRMVRITGRLNEPIRNRTLWALENEIMGCQFYIEFARVVFAGDPGGATDIAEYHERHIRYVRWKIRREIRRLKRLRAQPGFREDAVPPPPDKLKVVDTRKEAGDGQF